MAGEAAGDGHEDAVVEAEGEEHHEDGEDGEGGRRDLEVRGDVAVHGARLLDGEGVVVRGGGDEEDADGPDREHSDDRFHLLDAVDRRHPPQLRPPVQHVAVLHDRRAVQEPATIFASRRRTSICMCLMKYM